MKANIRGLLDTARQISIEQDVPIPYTDSDLTSTFHRDAVILLAISEMFVGESALMPAGVLPRDMQPICLGLYPRIFTYYCGFNDKQTRVWRLK